MKSITSREEHIADRLSRFIKDDLLSASAAIPRDAWTEQYGPAGLSMFGIGEPHEYTDEVPFVVPFCPALIADVTADLSDDEVGTYLTIVEHLFAQMLAALGAGDVEAGVYRGFDRIIELDEMHNMVRAAGEPEINHLRLFTETQLRWLERQDRT